MGILDGGIARLFGQAFSGMYLPATLYGAAGPTYAPGGNVIAWDALQQACRAQIDAIDWSMRDGYIEGDVKIIILALGILTPPTNDSEIEVAAQAYAVPGGYQRWKLSAITFDAAASHYVARGRKA